MRHVPWNLDLTGRALSAAAVLAAVILALTGCGGGSREGATEAGGEPPTTAEPAALADVVDVGELRELFDAAAGKPRLLLLLSPT